MENILKQEQDSSGQEHLIEGFRPIMVCVGTRNEFGEEISKIKYIEDVGRDVEYSDRKNLIKIGFKIANTAAIISNIDEKPKFTKGLAACTSLVAVGRETGSQSEISFLTHQSPSNNSSLSSNIQLIWKEGYKEFVEQLKMSLDELKKRCQEGSVDIVITGGDLDQSLDYQNTIDMISVIVEERMGFRPLVVCGPKERTEGDMYKKDTTDDVYFDTANRRLYLLRPSNVKVHNASFKTS